MVRFFALVAMGVGIFLQPALAASVSKDTTGQRIAEGFVRPALAQFAQAATNAARDIQDLCVAPDEARLETAHSSFTALVAAWSRVSTLRFGPLQRDNRYERLFFWPDTRGVIIRQVQAALVEKDEMALMPGAFATKSVAVQGLPALEFVLHGAGKEQLKGEAMSYRCHYGAAVAVNIRDIAEDVASGWTKGTPFHDAFASPSPDRDLYRSAEEVNREIVKALGTTLQFIRNAELLPALGATLDEARGKRAPLWRSDLTFVLVDGQINALLDLLALSGFHHDQEADAFVDRIRFDLNHAREAIGKLMVPAKDAFTDPVDRDRIRYVIVALNAANATLGEELSAALGLTMGFNALDGD